VSLVHVLITLRRKRSRPATDLTCKSRKSVSFKQSITGCKCSQKGGKIFQKWKYLRVCTVVKTILNHLVSQSNSWHLKMPRNHMTTPTSEIRTTFVLRKHQNDVDHQLQIADTTIDLSSVKMVRLRLSSSKGRDVSPS
jgi:hypothetical protein